MLRKLDRYILNRFFKYFFINLLIITGILWFTKIVKFLEIAADKNISFFDFMFLSLLVLFNLVSFLIPVVILIAVIFALYSFYNSKELFVFKAAGLSRIEIIKPFICAFSLVLLLNYLLLFYVTPFAERKMNDLTIKLANQFLISVIEEDSFNHLDENTTIFVDKKNKADIFENLLIYSKDVNGNDIVLNASQAKLIKHNKKVILALNQGNRYVIDKQKIITDSLIFDRYLTDLDFVNEDRKNFIPKRKISEYYIGDLFNEEITSQYDIAKVTMEIQHRILWPWLGVILGIMAITILLYGEYDRKGNFRKNILVIIIALIFVAFYFVTKSLIAQKIHLSIIGYGYIIIPLPLLLWLNLANRVRIDNIAD